MELIILSVKELSTRIMLKRDTSATWDSENPILLNGEKIIVDTAVGQIRMKTGDGVKSYSQLPFDDEKIGLATVAKTGSYYDLSNKPVEGADYGRVYYGTCDGTADAQTATIAGLTSYYNGLAVVLRINVSAQRCATININNIGVAYLRARGDAISTTSTSASYVTAGRDILFVYSSEENAFRAVWSYEGADTTDMHRPSYMRRTVGENALYSYKICGVDIDGRLQPLTLEAGTGTNKTVNTKPLNPDLFYYYGSTITVATGGAPSASYIYDAASCSSGNYTFNDTLSTYKSIYLKGTINAAGLFVMDNSTSTSWYVLVPANTAGITLSTYFETGKVYIYLGSTYSTKNYVWLSSTHPRYIFDGTNLLPHEIGYVKNYIDSLNGNGVAY